MLRFLALLLLFSSLAIAEEPWGKDADLSMKQGCCPLPQRNGIAQALIRFHQVVISPADGPRSHYYPSSSQYAMNAINKHGFLMGYILGCDRLTRENEEEWIYPKCQIGDAYLKYDPVP